MYTKSYFPQFPYVGEQVTIGSGRLLFHAKDDSVLIFADKAISLATSGSLHVNAVGGTFINSQTIELGLNAQEYLIKGNTAINELRLLYSSLRTFVNAVGAMSESELALSIMAINKSATTLSKNLTDLQNRLPDMLSTKIKTV